jgi:small-conductance mechanosensitive channel
MPDVTLDNLIWMLTALGAVVVLLTRMRLSAEDNQSGHAQVPMTIVNAHTVMGVIALAAWIYYLTSPDYLIGLVALAALWIVVVIGILILLRWLPGSGRHATEATDDSWAQGPALSILGHIGMFLGVAFFTWAVFADKIT